VVGVSGDDDWFERALRDDDETESRQADHEPDDVDGTAATDEESGADGEPETTEVESSAREDEADGAASGGRRDSGTGGNERDDETSADAADGVRGEEPSGAGRRGDDADRGDGSTGGPDAADDPFGGVHGDTDAGEGSDVAQDPFGGPVDDGGDGASESPFDEDFSEAFANAPGAGTEGGGGSGGGGRSDPFGGGPDAADDPFGGGESGEPFPGRDGFGFGGEASDDGPEFDEEDFDSDIERVDVGIEGLDEMILGGVPRRSLMVAVGSAGTGKTTFGLQFLNHALERGENAVYITLEESRHRIVDTAEEKGWPFREYEAENRLVVVDLDPIEMANSLGSIQNDLPRLVDSFGADRLVLDSVSLLEMMYDSTQKRRSQVFNFTRSLKDAGVTTMLTSEASADNPYVSRHGIVEYLADAVFVLQYVRPSDFRETRLAIEIQKIRDANHSRETKPYELTNEGISVYGRANIF
jgi:KaiC domain protein